MAYIETFDTALPGGGRDLSLGDDDIRQMKRALLERLLTVVNDLDEDPLALKAAMVGTIAARPNPPVAPGMLYFASDEGKLYVAVAGTPNVWQEVAPAAEGSAPAAPGVIGKSSSVNYNSALGLGAKVTNLFEIPYILTVHWIGRANTDSWIRIELNEVTNADWHVHHLKFALVHAKARVTEASTVHLIAWDSETAVDTVGNAVEFRLRSVTATGPAILIEDSWVVADCFLGFRALGSPF
jgi:hypothetical protein